MGGAAALAIDYARAAVVLTLAAAASSGDDGGSRGSIGTSVQTGGIEPSSVDACWNNRRRFPKHRHLR